MRWHLIVVTPVDQWAGGWVGNVFMCDAIASQSFASFFENQQCSKRTNIPRLQYFWEKMISFLLFLMKVCVMAQLTGPAAALPTFILVFMI